VPSVPRWPCVTPRNFYSLPLAHGSALELGLRPLVMGILNVTPDSFAEVAPLTARAAVDLALQMESDGADLIDVGGESTRPGAEPVSAGEEADRVLPVIEALRGRLRIPISIDTYKSSVADAALGSGAAMVNDVSGLLYDPEMAGVVASRGAAVVLMHTRGRPKAMYEEAQYQDLIAEVTLELRDRMSCAMAAGVPIERILVDPGLGFAKQPMHSYGVLARLHDVAAALDRPVVLGPSRKSFLREAAGGRAAPDRDWATAAAVAAAVLSGVHIVRVHAVAEMVQVVRAAEAIRRAQG
jgi:dihydropteroate synthase